MFMQRIFLIIFIILAGVFTVQTYENNRVTNSIIPENTIASEENFEIKSVTIESSTTTDVVAKKENEQKKQTTETKPETVVIQKSAITAPKPTPNFEIINSESRKAVVNIFCSARNDSFSPISGTGILVNSDGIILTNAHVAQYLLLKDLYYENFIECSVRTGSPAYPKYKVELVYISPDWIKENRDSLRKENPEGIGENDFGFLRITGNLDGSEVSEKISYIKPNTTELLDIGNPVVLVSYPAGFLGGQSVNQNLNLTSAITIIQDIFTFKENTVDLISVGGTVLSQRGSSGGAVVDENSGLVGVISTSSNGDTTSQRDLRAITLAYINRTLKQNLNLSVDEFLSQDISLFTKNFQTEVAPELKKILKDSITSN